MLTKTERNLIYYSPEINVLTIWRPDRLDFEGKFGIEWGWFDMIEVMANHHVDMKRVLSEQFDWEFIGEL